MNEYELQLNGNEAVANDVQKKVQVVGIKNLDVSKAKELGLFDRISNLMCLFHTTISAAYSVYGKMDYLLGACNIQKRDIQKACNDFERSVNKFLTFWTDYYAKGDAGVEINREKEILYHQLMQWAQLPESWNLGDKQRTNTPTDVVIEIDQEDRVLRLKKTVVSTDAVGDVEESWCVTRFDKDKQYTIYENMDKASAVMVAKRLSSEDASCLYTASIITDYTERKTIVTPFKAYKGGDVIGSIRKEFQKEEL